MRLKPLEQRSRIWRSWSLFDKKLLTADVRLLITRRLVLQKWVFTIQPLINLYEYNTSILAYLNKQILSHNEGERLRRKLELKKLDGADKLKNASNKARAVS